MNRKKLLKNILGIFKEVYSKCLLTTEDIDIALRNQEIINIGEISYAVDKLGEIPIPNILPNTKIEFKYLVKANKIVYVFHNFVFESQMSDILNRFLLPLEGYNKTLRNLFIDHNEYLRLNIIESYNEIKYIGI